MLTGVTSSTAGFGKSLQKRLSFYESLERLTALYQTEIHGLSSRHCFPGREDFRRCSTQIGLLSSTEKSNIYFTEPQVLEGLFRRFCLSSGLASLPKELSGGVHSIYEKKLYLDDGFGNLGIIADSTLVPVLSCADSANQVLSSALTSNSLFKSSLSNIDQGGRLSTLEARLGTIQKDMGRVDLGILHQRDRDQARFMDRWG